MAYLSLQIVVILISLIYYYFTKYNNYWKERNVPGPRPAFLFGNLKEYALRNKHVGMIYNDVYNDYPNEKVVGINRMGAPALVLRDLDIIKQILVKDFDLFPERGIDYSEKHLGDNLFHSNEKVWRALKRKLTPMFTACKLTHITHAVGECADRFVNYMEGLCDKPTELEMYYYFKKYTIATIVAFSFDLHVDVLNDANSAFDKLDKDIFTTTYLTELDMLFPGILKMCQIPLFPEAPKRFSHNIVKTVLKERNGIPSKRNDVIDILLKLKEKALQQIDNKDSLEITQSVMASQSFIFFGAGYGSNACALSYMMFRLAQNPDVQEKLIKEIDEVLEKHDGKISYEVVKGMVYLEKVFFENLRMNPLTNSIQRVSVADYKIPGTDVTVPKGKSIIISPYAIQRDEKYFPNPLKFDPERFTAEKIKDRHAGAYMPFGMGPRTCLGMRFAKIQSAVCVIKLLSKFRVEPSDKTPELGQFHPARMLLFPKKGIYVNLIPRKV